MSSEFETYLMRGLVVFLGGATSTFLWREIRAKDGMWKAINKNKEDHDQALLDARHEFETELRQVTSQFRNSVDQLTTNITQLTAMLGKLEATVAREYATREDLREIRMEIREAIRSCSDTCPGKN